jgi:hypothetical protein
MTLEMNFELKGMQMCKISVGKWIYFWNFFKFISFSSISYPTQIVYLESNCNIGFPISPKPHTTFFCHNLSLYLWSYNH